jgi:alpha-glucosidase
MNSGVLYKTLVILLSGGLIFSCQLREKANDREIPDPGSPTGYPISSPPPESGLNPFYKKYASVNEIPVISSAKVPDEAIRAACRTVQLMTNHLPENVLHEMVRRGVRVGVMGKYEGTTDIPEHAYLKRDTSLNWDVRARGLGGTLELPLTTCAEENLLCYQIDKYHAEDILIHEFAHTIHSVGIVPLDSMFNKKLKDTMEKAISEGKYKNTYAATDIFEYWAEGVQDWFNVNAEVPVPDGKHNFLNTRDELKKYDPGLYSIISKYFPPVSAGTSCHSKENLYSN